jgi:hypothetical protein
MNNYKEFDAINSLFVQLTEFIGTVLRVSIRYTNKIKGVPERMYKNMLIFLIQSNLVTLKKHVIRLQQYWVRH